MIPIVSPTAIEPAPESSPSKKPTENAEPKISMTSTAPIPITIPSRSVAATRDHQPAST